MQTNTTSNQSYPTQEQDTALYPRSFLNHDTISAAFIEELASLESIQDNLNYIGEILKSYIAPEQHPEDYVYEDLQTMMKELHSVIPQLSGLEVSDVQNLRFDAIYDKVKDFAIRAYREHETEVINFYNDIVSQYDENYIPQVAFSHDNVIRNLERDILLRVVDNKWIDHLHNIDMLRDGIGLRAYGQKDPLIEYKREAYDLFNKMMYEIQADTVKHLFRTKFGIQVMNGPTEDMA